MSMSAQETVHMGTRKVTSAMVGEDWLTTAAYQTAGGGVEVVQGSSGLARLLE